MVLSIWTTKIWAVIKRWSISWEAQADLGFGIWSELVSIGRWCAEIHVFKKFSFFISVFFPFSKFKNKNIGGDPRSETFKYGVFGGGDKNPPEAKILGVFFSVLGIEEILRKFGDFRQWGNGNRSEKKNYNVHPFYLLGEPIPCPRGLQTLFSLIKSFKTCYQLPKYFENTLNNIFDQNNIFLNF